MRSFIAVPKAFLHFFPVRNRKKYQNKKSVKNCLFRYLLPVANPDGYKYTFEHDRLWRKTRLTKIYFSVILFGWIPEDSVFGVFTSDQCLLPSMTNTVSTVRTLITPPCRGVDPNRNFPVFWDEGGSSDEPCSQVYRGPQNFSEVLSIQIKYFSKQNLFGNKIGIMISHWFC